MTRRIIKLKGGPGSGHFGHVGRPGKRGGSLSSGFGTTISQDDIRIRRLKAVLKGKGIKPADIKKASERTKNSVYVSTYGDNYYGDPQQVFENYCGLTGNVADFAETAYVLRDEKSGLRSQVTSIESNYSGVKISGNIYNANGQVVGNFVRKLKDDGEVYHDYFSMNEIYRGTGFATKFYQQSELTYLAVGAKNVTIYANIDVGGYAWARMGFNADDGYDLEKFRTTTYNKWYSMYNDVTTPSQHKAMANSIGNMKMWEIAAFTYDNQRIGKEVLLGSDWHATKTLDPNDEGFIVGQLYYQTKGQ